MLGPRPYKRASDRGITAEGEPVNLSHGSASPEAPLPESALPEGDGVASDAPPPALGPTPRLGPSGDADAA